jgi:hypothetical protein
MAQRSYSRDIGRVSFILGCLMIVAALGFTSISLFTPVPAHKMGWVFEHPLLAGLLQLSLGIFLALTAVAFLRGRPGGRAALRVALTIVALGFAIFSIMWVQTMGAMAGGVPAQRVWFPPVPLEVFAAVASLSWIVPMILAVRYLGTPRGRLDQPNDSRGAGA